MLKPGGKKRVKGESPLRGQGAELPCGVGGNAPTVGRVTISKESANKGAGSEASLPVTLRSRRSAPKLLFPTSMLCRARWARPDCLSSRHSLSFSQAGDFAPAGATRGLSGDILRARNAVGESCHPRGRKRRRARRQGFAALRAENRHERAVPRRGVYAAVCGWKIARSDAASAGENDDDGSKIPGGMRPRPRGQLGEAG